MGERSEEQLRLMHVYAQQYWHDEAYIVGNAAALRALRLAIDWALKRGMGKTAVFAGDGEGYDVVVVALEDEKKWPHLVEPYTADYAQALKEGTIFPWSLVREGTEVRGDGL